jgi:hypothetical protein
MTKAGSFFDEDTPQYETYKRLMTANFGIKIEHRDFQVNDFLKKKRRGDLSKDKTHPAHGP